MVKAYWRWRTISPSGDVIIHRRKGETNGQLLLPGGCTAHVADNMITYSVVGPGTFAVTYAQPNGTSQATVTTPWSVDVPLLTSDQFIYLSAQEWDGNASASFSCQYTLGGEIQATAPASGAYSICDVSN